MVYQTDDDDEDGVDSMSYEVINYIHVPKKKKNCVLDCWPVIILGNTNKFRAQELFALGQNLGTVREDWKGEHWSQ